MNIVMIGPFAFQPKGTVSVRAFFMARALVGRGHRVTILMPPYDHLADSGRTWEQEGVVLENATLRRNDLWRQIAVPMALARRATHLAPDLVHVFKPIGYSGLTGLYLRLFSRRPLVLDTDDWEGAGGWIEANPYPAAWKRFFAWQERWMARHADAVTVASRTLQTQVWGLGVDPERVLYAPNGPDVHGRDAEPVSAEEIRQIRQDLGVGEAPLALYLGHIPHGSDLDLALEAWARLGDRLPEGARLVIAGVGDGLPALQAAARQWGIADRVGFPGWIDRDRAAFYLSAADLIVNPYRDTLINRAKCAGKGVQAMALGKAVLTSRVGENLEYIEHRRSGLLAEPGDVDDLARLLLEALSDRTLTTTLGLNARQRIWERYDWDARIGAVEQLYQSVRA